MHSTIDTRRDTQRCCRDDAAVRAPVSWDYQQKHRSEALWNLNFELDPLVRMLGHRG
jgi:hypothetical protein